MGFSLFNLFKAGLLLTNAVLILHRKRFLSKFGMDDLANMGCDPSENPLKAQIINLMNAMQYLKVPLIGLNSVTIVFEMLLGGA
mmetsp:Transcript_21155/g.31015  ORF Transcript_21155/g.31015 Transcript_21155/m.31015 type:complete len:84 (+) Transcript_21155:156-407(+)